MKIQSRIAKAVVAGALGMLFLALLVLNLSSGERKIDHRIAHLYSVGGAQFVRTMGSLLEAPLVPGNDVLELLNGDQIFPSMLEAIRSARTFEEDKTHSRRMTLADWRARPWTEKLMERAAGLLRSQF